MLTNSGERMKMKHLFLFFSLAVISLFLVCWRKSNTSEEQSTFDTYLILMLGCERIIPHSMHSLPSVEIKNVMSR